MPTVTLAPGRVIHFLEFHPERTTPEGKPTVLLLHGLGATGESWMLQIPPLLEAGYPVLAPDARGFGKSTYPGKANIALMAADMAALLSTLHIHAVIVVGISMGGAIALQFALDHPDKIVKLALTNTFARLQPQSWRIWLYFAMRMVLVHTLGLPSQARFVAQRIFPLPEQTALRDALIAQICQADPRGYRATMRAIARFNVLPRLGEIKAPTLVVTAEDDRTVPVINQAPLAAGIPNARQVLIPGTGHGVIAEKPEIFNEILLGFLSE